MNHERIALFEELLDEMVNRATIFAHEYNNFLDTFTIVDGLPNKLPTNFDIEDITFENECINISFEVYEYCGNSTTTYRTIPFSWLTDDSDWQQQITNAHNVAMKERRDAQDRERIKLDQRLHEETCRELELLKNLQAKYQGVIK